MYGRLRNTEVLRASAHGASRLNYVFALFKYAHMNIQHNVSPINVFPMGIIYVDFCRFMS